MDSRFDWIDQQMAELRRDSLHRELVTKQALPQMRIRINGQELINFGSNDYLGIASENSHATQEAGYGSGASPLVSGFSPIHEQLQLGLAELEETEATVLFPTGFAANLGAVSSLTGAGDLILSDAANHASLIDGCRLSKAERFIYPHKDVLAVKALLAAQRSRFRRAFILTDSIFSMDGDCAPLEQLCDIADSHDAIMIVDEAHGTGVFGSGGSGLCQHLGVEHRVAIRVGTLSKAFGALGGFVAGPQNVIDYLVNVARPLIYSTALPPQVAAAALEGLSIIESQPHRRVEIMQRADRLREQIQGQWRIAHDQSQIIPIMVGDNQATCALAQRLLAEGFYVPAIRPPTVPSGTARLRISVSATHRDEDIDALADTLKSFA